MTVSGAGFAQPKGQDARGVQAGSGVGVFRFHVPVTLCISSDFGFVVPGPRPSLALENWAA